jgi:putative heme-binding domain-containing protein
MLATSLLAIAVLCSEPWADRELKVTEGLVFWLDASRQGEARSSEHLPATGPSGAIGIAFDGSGRRRHAVQRLGFAQPRLVAAGGRAVFRFDGRDDHLESLGPALAAEAVTAFLVAAPSRNPGGFVAFLASNAVGKRDYTTGFTIDQGPSPGPRFGSLNVEGTGFGGAVDLLNEDLPMGAFHTLEALMAAGTGGVRLLVDGKAQGQRDRKGGSIHLDELTVGARFYTNDANPASVRGFLEGDIAEVLLYDRALTDAECATVRSYLTKKHAGLDAALATAGGKPRRTVADPPPVQMLVPGFTVRELPLELPNINNLKYRADGALVALAYNGDIYLLTDRDGDGVEDHAARFWDNRGRLTAPIGMALTPPGDRRGFGVYVPSKGKCSLIVDTDGDNHADKEITVAEGWKPLAHGVDALGVARGADGSVYFGLGTASYENAYLVDAHGESHYDLHSERGTIVRVAPDFNSRQIVATGIRFPVALAFNRAGDLFATDQEGATWLPNGNPFDELLHVEPGRHYGFPPRHSRYLPGVVDEPSVFDYRPQHQSTCGLNFNEPVRAGGAIFGPDWWAGDAIVCGYSRGKVFRTKLVKTPAGYVGATSILACLNMLTVDACVAPDGSLAVAVHSGGPDWGSGPAGKGRLYKIAYTDRDRPQPVLAWASSARETRIAFDRPIPAELLRDLGKGIVLEQGASVAAGDRFESQQPGYEVVAAQMAEPRSDVAVHTVSVTPDRRTLVLATGPQESVASYAITLPGMGRPTQSAAGTLPQRPEIDLAYRLGGVLATWQSREGTATWSGWLPHLDLAIARSLTAGSAEHEAAWALMAGPGTLTLRAKLDLDHMLRPAVQPGSRIDDRLPPERVTLVLKSDAPLRVDAEYGREVRMPITPAPGEFMPLQVTLQTPGPARLEATYHTADDPRPRALAPWRFLPPWAAATSETVALRDAQPELEGGDWLRGRDVFFSETAKCGRCHSVRGQGGRIAPDLSNLVHRDVASVLRDIREPSFALNPDYITYSLALDDGRVLTGPVRTEGNTLYVGDAEGRETPIDSSSVEERKAAATSTMPDGLIEALGPAPLRDLLTFLLTPGQEPAAITREGAPPLRTRAEVDAIPVIQRPEDQEQRPLRIVLVDGVKDHGPDEHDYPLWKERWAKLLKLAPGVTVATARDWPEADDLANADVLIWYSANSGWSAERGKQLDAFLQRGGGLVYVHYAVNGRNTPEELARRIGLAWRDGRSKFRHGPLNLSFAGGHPITAGFKTLHLEDESYWALNGDPTSVDVLATAVEEGAPQPLLWARQAGKGRVVCSIPGHYTWTFDDPLFRILLLRGIAWSAGEPVDRLRELATIGVRMEAIAR